ncbi:MAG: IS4 family transposase [Tissierellales bacterium]|nr:IS4 family transposase [Tissierellales bacterium]
MNPRNRSSWAEEEFAEVNLGDKRLDTRLIKLCDRFSNSPESPINQACLDWAETKAAYRFFQNDKVEVGKMLAAHRNKTAQRAKEYKTVLALQDTSYFVYTNHPKTEGLGKMSLKKGKNVENIYSNGLIMHTCLAVTTKGLPIGLLDQKIFSRKLREKKNNKTKPHDGLPIEDKESYKWLEALENTRGITGCIQIVTVCDREADLYEFFDYSRQINSPVLVRANVDRTINRKSRYAEKDIEKLWEHMRKQPESGSYILEIQHRSKTKHTKEREARTAIVSVRFDSFTLNPPRNNIRHSSEKLQDIDMYAIYVLEENPPDGEEAIEWMLLTNLPVTSHEEAYEKIMWYCLRWRIEMYFKVLKSGFMVESCRLGNADRLAKYLTVMSIVAWRLFMITLIARTDPNTSSSVFLTDQEWKVLFLHTNKKKAIPKKPPSIGIVVIWIAKLGGYLARKSDGPPGTLTLWRGWKRLTDLTEGLKLAGQL